MALGHETGTLLASGCLPRSTNDIVLDKARLRQASFRVSPRPISYGCVPTLMMPLDA